MLPRTKLFLVIIEKVFKCLYVENKILIETVRPVSYTHLDVYKRQEQEI